LFNEISCTARSDTKKRSETTTTWYGKHGIEFRRNEKQLMDSIPGQTGEGNDANPKRQAEELAPKMAVDFDAFYAKRAVEHPEKTDKLLVMSDGWATVPLRFCGAMRVK
jgi:hypothetical protein